MAAVGGVCGCHPTLGCVPDVFQWMWEAEKRHAARQDTFCDLHVPATIVFSPQSPPTWWFTSVQDGALKRKRQKNVTIESILHAMGGGKRRKNSDEYDDGDRDDAVFGSDNDGGRSSGTPDELVALFVHASRVTEAECTERNQRFPHSGNAEAPHCCYLTLQGVHALLATIDLNEPTPELDGMLQPIATTAGDAFCVTWTPALTTVERRVNVHQRKRRRVRGRGPPLPWQLHCTFDGSNLDSDVERIRPDRVRFQRLRAAAGSLAGQCDGQVVFLRLHCKLDENQRLWAQAGCQLAQLQDGTCAGCRKRRVAANDEDEDDTTMGDGHPSGINNGDATLDPADDDVIGADALDFSQLLLSNGVPASELLEQQQQEEDKEQLQPQMLPPSESHVSRAARAFLERINGIVADFKDKRRPMRPQTARTHSSARRMRLIQEKTQELEQLQNNNAQ